MSEQENQQPKKRQFLFNPLKRPLPYIGLILAALIVIFQSTIRQYTANLVGDWLAGKIEETTGGLYNLDYNYVRFDIFTNELRIKNLSISLDTGLIDREAYLEQYSNLVELTTPVVVFKLRSLWDLLVNNKLNVAFIGIEAPQVDLLHGDLPEQIKEINKVKSTENLRQFLLQIEIDSFRVVHGKVNLALKDQEKHNIFNLRIRDFSILTKGFKLDKINPEKLLRGIYAKELLLEVNDQEILLPAARHKLAFKNFTLSTIDSVISLDSVRIAPIDREDSVAQADILLAELNINGIDFEKAYLEDVLDIKQFRINHPQILLNLQKMVHTASHKPDTTTDGLLTTHLKLPFHAINLQQFSIDKGQAYINHSQRVNIHNLYFNLRNIELDSQATTPARLIAKLNDYTLHTDSLLLYLPDSIHQLSTGFLQLSSRDSVVMANNVKLSPRPDKRQYKHYKQHGVGMVANTTIKKLALSGLDFGLALNGKKFLGDTLILQNPRINLNEYPYIKSARNQRGDRAIDYQINTVLLRNGLINHNRWQAGGPQRSQLKGVNMQITRLYAQPGMPGYKTLNINVQAGYSQLKNIKHTVRFTGLSANNLSDFHIKTFSLLPDSNQLDINTFKIDASGISIGGFARQMLKQRTLKIRSFAADQIQFSGRTARRQTAPAPGNKKLRFDRVEIDKIFLNKSLVGLNTPELNISLNELSTGIDSLQIDLTDTSRSIPVRVSDMTISHSAFSLQNKQNQTTISGSAGHYSESDSMMAFSDINIVIPQKLQLNLHKIGLYGLDRQMLLDTAGISFRYLLADQPRVSLTWKKDTLAAIPKADSGGLARPDSLRKLLLSQFTFLDFDSLLVRKGKITLQSKSRNTVFDDLNLLIGPYRLDSTTSAQQLLKPGRFNISLAAITSTSQNDTLNVHGLSLDLLQNKLYTGTINLHVKQRKNRLTATIPGVFANGFSLANFLKKDFSMDTIRMSGGKFTLYTPLAKDKASTIDKTENDYMQFIERTFKKTGKSLPFDTMRIGHLDIAEVYNIAEDTTTRPNRFKALLSKLKLAGEEENDSLAADTLARATRPIPADSVPVAEEPDTLIAVAVPKSSRTGIIKHIGINNSFFYWKQDTLDHPQLSQLNFSIHANGLLLDSLHKFNLFSHLQSLVVTVKDYSTLLPDKLNMIKIGKIQLDTHKGELAVQDFNLIPQVNKYDYAKKVGHQASWQHLQGLNLRLQGLNLYSMIHNRGIEARKLAFYDGKLDIFRDKELPIPVNQRRPMPQDALKNLKFPVLIDSITMEGFDVSVTNRLNSHMPEGNIFFTDIDATITNVVNTDSAILARRYALVTASTKVMGKGPLTAHFTFDLFDEDNEFLFDGHLAGPMDAREFNSILSAMAFVKIESGTIKDLKLQAKGDNLYATGNMIFLYNDLKVSTINKKNLKTTGMGKVLKTFFANTFVVKKNNPALKFFPREGAMYYERNPQKIIFDYIIKTTLSGIVSSIGARNARKDIKRIQRESKKQKEAERKALRKAERKGK